jgi:hypothetical protein
MAISARRDDLSNQDLLILQAKQNDKILATWMFGDDKRVEYIRDEEGGTIYFPHALSVKNEESSQRLFRKSKRRSQGQEDFLAVLRQSAPVMFNLNADRRLDSDAVPDPSDEVELRRVMHFEEPKRINDLVVRSREIALSQALSSAARWISRKAVLGTNQGSVNVHTVYLNMLRHLVGTPDDINSMNADSPELEGLINRLETIETRTGLYAQYELETKLTTGEFKKALQEKSNRNVVIAARLLKPYIESVEGRLGALKQIYDNIDTFISTINSLLQDKKISFTLSHGFELHNRLQSKLETSQLSSGEQQLLLLFCYVLAGRDQPSAFMIDEPEISLNVKWQRKLVQSLLEVTKGAQMQFVFASHSMELLAQHRDRVVRLVNNQ